MLAENTAPDTACRDRTMTSVVITRNDRIEVAIGQAMERIPLAPPLPRLRRAIASPCPLSPYLIDRKEDVFTPPTI